LVGVPGPSSKRLDLGRWAEGGSSPKRLIVRMDSLDVQRSGEMRRECNAYALHGAGGRTR
jgi:hypothetical protein